MKKRLISIGIIMCLVFVIYTPAVADYTPSATRSGLKSSGAIVYQDGNESVVIDANDLYVIADKLDTYKTALVNQLATMHTYLTTSNKGVSLSGDDGINVVHAKSDNLQTVDAVLVEFDTLLAGVAASQSIPTKAEEYGYDLDTQFYKTGDGIMTIDPTIDKVEQISIAASTADNLSAGCAAWVNGELVLGKGTDNRTYYNLGYAEGYNAKIDGAYISYTYHKHINGKNEVVNQSTVYGAANPGGCYRSAGHEHNVTGACPSHIEQRDFSHDHWVSGTSGDNIWCPHCGFCSTFEVGTNGRTHHCVWYADERVYSCGFSANKWTVGCGKTTNTIESAKIVFP